MDNIAPTADRYDHMAIHPYPSHLISTWTVPDGTTVRNECVAVFGGSATKTMPPAPGAPTVIVKGFIGFGGVEVRGLSKKQRKRRDCGS